MKTGVMMQKIQLCITGINYILIYIKLEKVVLNCNNISQYYHLNVDKKNHPW